MMPTPLRESTKELANLAEKLSLRAHRLDRAVFEQELVMCKNCSHHYSEHLGEHVEWMGNRCRKMISSPDPWANGRREERCPCWMFE